MSVYVHLTHTHTSWSLMWELSVCIRAPTDHDYHYYDDPPLPALLWFNTRSICILTDSPHFSIQPHTIPHLVSLFFYFCISPLPCVTCLCALWRDGWILNSGHLCIDYRTRASMWGEFCLLHSSGMHRVECRGRRLSTAAWDTRVFVYLKPNRFWNVQLTN